MNEMKLGATLIVVVLLLVAGTSYACQEQRNQHFRTMSEKGFCRVQLGANYEWRPCEQIRGVQ